MLNYAIVFLVIALITSALAFTGSADVTAKFPFLDFLVLFAVPLILGHRATEASDLVVTADTRSE
jgi:uncharacterized membrane protein YtjA (UPF0391 family)